MSKQPKRRRRRRGGGAGDRKGRFLCLPPVFFFFFFPSARFRIKTFATRGFLVSRFKTFFSQTPFFCRNVNCANKTKQKKEAAASFPNFVGKKSKILIFFLSAPLPFLLLQKVSLSLSLSLLIRACMLSQALKFSLSLPH